MRLEVDNENHAVIYSEVSCRIEITRKPNGHILVYGYRGTEDDEDQEPSVIFDSEKG